MKFDGRTLWSQDYRFRSCRIGRLRIKLSSSIPTTKNRTRNCAIDSQCIATQFSRLQRRLGNRIVAAATSTSHAGCGQNAWAMMNARVPATGKPIDAVDRRSRMDDRLPTSRYEPWPSAGRCKQGQQRIRENEVPAAGHAVVAVGQNATSHLLVVPSTTSLRGARTEPRLTLTGLSYQSYRLSRICRAERSRWGTREMSPTLAATRQRRMVMFNDARPLARLRLPIIFSLDSSASIATGLAY
jgi:hypothetical protein